MHYRTGIVVLLGAALVAWTPAARAALVTVRNTDDAGDGSLRKAIADAADGDTIVFAEGVRGTIELEETLAVDTDVSIKGPGAEILTLRGASEVDPVVQVDGDVTIAGVSIAGGARGIEVQDGKLTLIECAVRDHGGDGIDNRARLTLVRSLVAKNGRHGVASLDGRSVACVNSTVSGNGGDGIANAGGTVTAASCTIAANRGRGLDGGRGGAAVQNTLLAANGANCTGRVTSKGHSLSSDESCGFTAAGDQNAVDPRLGTLFANGGPTLTHALAAGSLAVDAGDPAGCAEVSGGTLLSVDQRGLRRPGGARCDIGAYEAQPAAGGRVVGRIVALIDGDPITLYEIKEFAASDVRIRQAGATDQAALIEALVTKRLIDKEIEAQGIVIQDADIDRYIATIRERNQLTEEQLAKALAQQGLTPEKYRQQIREELQRAQLINREIRGKVNITPEDVERYYREHHDELGAPEQIVISDIVIRLPPNATPAEVDAAMARAQQIVKELEDGADFAELAQQHSEDPNAKSGGKLGTFKKGELMEELETVVVELDEGETSKPVRTGNAIHIVRVDERIAATDTLPEKEAEEIKERLYAAALEERYNRWLREDLRQRHHVEIRP